MLGIKALDTAAVVLLLSALLKIKALQANMAQLLNPWLMNPWARLYLDSRAFLVHVCKAGGKGILSNARLSRWRGTVYPTPAAVFAQPWCQSGSTQPVPVPRQRCHSGSAPGGFPAWGKEKDVSFKREGAAYRLCELVKIRLHSDILKIWPRETSWTLQGHLSGPKHAFPFPPSLSAHTFATA